MSGRKKEEKEGDSGTGALFRFLAPRVADDGKAVRVAFGVSLGGLVVQAGTELRGAQRSIVLGAVEALGGILSEDKDG